MTRPIGASGNNPVMLEQFAATTAAQQVADPEKPALARNSPPGGVNSMPDNTFVYTPKAPPPLSAPAEFSAEDLTDQLRSIQSRQQDMQLQAGKSAIQTNKTKLEAQQTARMEKINEASEAMASKQHSDDWKFWLGVAGSVAAIIGSAVAFVVSCATGNVVGAVFSACACAGAAFSLVNTLNSKYEFLKDEDGKAMNLQVSGLATKLAAEILEAAGVDKEKAESIGKIVAGAVAIVGTMGLALLVDQAFVTNIVSGGMELGGVDQETMGWVNFGVSIATACTVGLVALVLSGGGSAASKGAEAAAKGADLAAKSTDLSAKVAGFFTNAKNLGPIIQAAIGLLGGTLKVGESSAGIVSTIHQKEASDATADKKTIDAIVVALMAKMQENTEDLKKLLQEIEASIQGISDMINANAQSHSLIASNLSGRTLV